MLVIEDNMHYKHANLDVNRNYYIMKIHFQEVRIIFDLKYIAS